MQIYIIASIFGVVFGAVLQYWFGQRAETRRNVQIRRTEAYVDLIKAISGLAKTSGNPQSDSARQFAALYSEARARVAIYGSTTVVARLADFLRSGVEFEAAIVSGALTEVVKAMRADGIGTKEPLAPRDLQQVLFGRE